MRSMGSVVGEKILRIISGSRTHYSTGHFYCVRWCSHAGRHHVLDADGQNSAALKKLSEKKVPYISVLCDTCGGTSASFAMLGDINIGEPGALISFAGPRVIEQTIRQKLPKGFQRSEFCWKKECSTWWFHGRNYPILWAT